MLDHAPVQTPDTPLPILGQTCTRPWGRYTTIDLGARHQVKHITVTPGGTLSLQSHTHRAEHWSVVSGTAQVTVGAETRLLREDESVYIPLGAIHRLANPGKVDLVLIEVQVGAYLGEDDITRYEDVYARPVTAKTGTGLPRETKAA